MNKTNWKKGLNAMFIKANNKGYPNHVLETMVEDFIESLINQAEKEKVEEIIKAVEDAGDLSQFGSASGSMMKGSMLKYLNSLTPKTEEEGLK